VAVHAFGNTAKVATAAARAGADLLLYTEPGEAARAYDVLLHRFRTRSLSRSTFEASVARVLRLRHRLGASR
jgi:hypothetical protein